MNQDSPIKILVVDDEPETVDTISTLLEKKCSAETQSAYDCKSAIEKIYGSSFDLITLDYQLPDGDGIKLLKEIKSIEKAPPVVMITGHGDENTAVEAFKYGASGYVVKDTRISVMLVEEVKSALLKEELRLAENALIDSEKKYRQVFENMTSAFAVYNVVGDAEDFIFVDFNKAGEKAEGVKRKDLIGKSIKEVFPGVSDSGLLEIFQRVWRTGKTERYPISQYADDRIMGWRENFVYKLPDGNIVAIYDDVTEKVVAEDALKKSESKLREITDMAAEGIVVSDSMGKFEFVNPRAAKIFGYENPDELTGLEVINMYSDPLERKVIYDELERAGFVRDYEIELKKRDGSRFWARLNATLRRGEMGEVAGATVLCADITREKMLKTERDELIRNLQDRVEELSNAKQSLKLDESKLKDISDYAVEGIISSGPDQCIEYANKKAAELLGFNNPEDLAGSAAEDFYSSPGERQSIMEDLKEDGYVEDFEVVLKRRDGSPFLARLNASLKTDEGGNVVGATAFFSDITRQKRMEEHLICVLDILPDAVFLMDKDGTIRYTNEAMDKLFGGKPETGSRLTDLRGKIYQSYVADTDIPYPIEKAPIFKAIKGEASIVDDVEMEVDGKRLPLEIIGAPVPGPDGNINWAVAVTRDITARKAYERELKSKNSELDAYAHAVSHDLKGPLASITASTQLLKELLGGGIDKDTEELLGIIRGNTETAWQRIGDFLTLAESGLEPSSVEMINVGELMEGILEVLSPLIVNGGVVTKVEGDLGELKASKLQIEQIFSNLISNALRHNDSMKPEIVISRLESESEAVKKYLVRDNGSGIPAEELEYIFIPFHKKSDSGRSGLGLSIARKIAYVYRGDIQAYNCDGACFEVTLIDYDS